MKNNSNSVNACKIIFFNFIFAILLSLAKLVIISCLKKNTLQN